MLWAGPPVGKHRQGGGLEIPKLCYPPLANELTILRWTSITEGRGGNNLQKQRMGGKDRCQAFGAGPGTEPVLTQWHLLV